ncbi:Protein kinase domain-containing protein [Meloidogyne graminicola]|uniref:Protein kinase domain-containing protein n=1 Tax=Meloidogyne graminicola TaxID=189291 RepID=A0A8S9ZNE2_9BILA|nr:Protein kinase domain-containing protein [Meloidogyne graminicola]
MWAETLTNLIKEMSVVGNRYNEESCSSSNQQIDENTQESQQIVKENEENIVEYYEDELPELTELSKELCPPIQDQQGYLLCKTGYWITNKYKLKLLGDGVFARVYLVAEENCQKTSPTHKALKIAYREAALHEIKVLTKLHSSNNIEKDELISSHLVVRLLEHFYFYDHTCLVFEPYGKSIFDFMKGNLYHPYPLEQIRYIAYQLILAVNHVHNCGLTHTDLKPENILFVNSDEYVLKPRWDTPYEEHSSNSKRTRKARKGIRVLKVCGSVVGFWIIYEPDATIRLIDFGSAVFDDERHEETITTRHYRAPEKMDGLIPVMFGQLVVFFLNFILAVLFFPKMDPIQHMASIERILGPVPTSMKKASSCELYKNNNQLNCSRELKQSVEERFRELHNYIKERTLSINPSTRINLKTAREHAFFENLDKSLRIKAENGGK